MYGKSFLGMVVGVACVLALRGAADQDVFDGEWHPQSIIVDGNPLEKSKFAQVKLSIKQNNYAVYQGDKKVSAGVFIVDKSKNPHAIDIVADAPNGKKLKLLGIVKIQGDTMTICAAPSAKGRPTEFEAAKGSQRQLVVYKRK